MSEPASVPADLVRLQAALMYPERGWHVFPVHYIMPDGACSCGSICGRAGKHPKSKHGYKDATRESDLIKGWWTDDSHYNIGMACGMSRVVVLDIDPRNDGDWSLVELEKERGSLPPTLTSLTGGGGQHYIYSIPDGVDRVKSRVLKQGIDVKSDGGYIVLPPSSHASGRDYIWDSGDNPIAVAPFWLLESPKRIILSDRAPLDGILGAAFIAAGMSGPPEGPDKIRVQCPWESEHSQGARFDGSTLVFGPTINNWGYFYCAHSHCQSRLETAGREQRNGTVLAALPKDAVLAAKAQVKGADRDLARVAREPWERSLQFGRNSQLSPDPGNLALILSNQEEWQKSLAFDESRDRIYWTKTLPKIDGLDAPKVGSALNEHAYIYVSQSLSMTRHVTFRKETVQDVLISIAQDNTHNSLVSQLSALQWDAVPRLDTWLSMYMQAKDSPYTRFVGRSWLISAIARAFSPGCQVDHTLVLESSQGKGKSSAFQILAREWYLGSLPRIDDKDARHILVASWICEIQELAAFRGIEAQKIKAFLTDRVDKYRPPYGRFMVARPRACVFAASTNEGDYIQDTTGARRFWPVRVGYVDMKALERDRDCLLAEARDAYLAGHTWYPEQQSPIHQEIEHQQEERQAVDPWEPVVANLINRCVSGELRMVDLLTACNVPLERQDRMAAKRIGDILRKHGWTKARSATLSSDASRPYVWLPPAETNIP